MRKRFKELCIEVTKNREELKEQRELIDFLLEHDRNDVVIHNVGGIVWDCMAYSNDIEVEYISHIAIKRVRISMGLCNKAEVIQNECEKIVIKTYNKDEPNIFAYYRIIKYSGEVADVTEYYQQEEPTTVANPDTPTDKGEENGNS